MSSLEGPVLVYGATGTQGGPVVRRLLARGVDVRALVRAPDASAAQALAAAGAEVVAGDLGDPPTLVQASRGASAVLMVGSASVPPSEYVEHVRNALTAARHAAVAHVVLDTGGVVPDAATGAAGVDAKRASVALAADLTPQAVVLTDTIYLENVSGLMRDAIAGGVLPYPIAAQVPVAWQSLSDHAAYAAAAVTRPDLAGRRFDLGGPEAVTGQDLADAIAVQVGRPVTYQPVAPHAFQAQLEPFLGVEVAATIAGTYAWESGAGAPLLRPDTATAQKELGVTPTSLRDWIAATF